MARVKLSEYDAKRLLLPSLNQKFTGFSVTINTTAKEIATHFQETNLVVKVDEGVKKRGKRGLVKVNLVPSDIPQLIKQWQRDGWSRFLIEPVIEHAPDAEKYLALERTRAGWQISYSDKGGIDVESSWDHVVHTLPQNLTHAVNDKLIPVLEKYHIVFLEMNPIVVRGNQFFPLDMAAEIDDAALGMSDITSLNLHPVKDKTQSAVETQIARLDASTPASLKFRLINPRGAIWMLLSGGGASLVLADEVADQGMGDELANYGEYSGAPTTDDVYAYTKLVLDTLLQSPAKKKALVIGGGVANFTDIVKTFSGVIRALDEKKHELVRSKVKVFVRRGGPNEEKGLAMMSSFLQDAKLLGSVHGHNIALTQVIREVKKYL